MGNSGAQAINLAYLWGARRMILVGFDMRSGEVDGKKDQMHWFGDHPKPLQNPSAFDQFITGMGPMAVDLRQRDVEVINTSAKSAIPYWPKRTLEQALS